MQSPQQTFLVLRAQAGDVEAFDALLRQYQEPLFRCVRNITCDHELAEDVLQDVFVILHEKLRWLREPSLFRAWAYRIASREALRRLQKERRVALVHDEDLMQSLEDPRVPDAQHQDWIIQLPAMLERLSPGSRAVLVLHYLEGLTLQEVADVLGLALGTVKSRLAYGLELLRQDMG